MNQPPFYVSISETELSARAFDGFFASQEKGIEKEQALFAASALLIAEKPNRNASGLANGQDGDVSSAESWNQELAVSLWDDGLLAG